MCEAREMVDREAADSFVRQLTARRDEVDLRTGKRGQPDERSSQRLKALVRRLRTG